MARRSRRPTITTITAAESSRFDRLFTKRQHADPRWQEIWHTYVTALEREKARGVDLEAVAKVVEVTPLYGPAGLDTEKSAAAYRTQCRRALKLLDQTERAVRWVYALDCPPARYEDGRPVPPDPDALHLIDALQPVRARFAAEVPRHRPKGHLDEARQQLRSLGVHTDDIDTILIPVRSRKH
ncbi:MAG: hypothetical protein ACE148_03375 [Vicinamibacterales bacterium]